MDKQTLGLTRRWTNRHRNCQGDEQTDIGTDKEMNKQT